MKKYIWIIIIVAVAVISPMMYLNRVWIWGELGKHFDGFATLISAGVVIAVYYFEQRSKKINAARLVLKEIDGAISVAKTLVDNGRYDQKIIAIATDNWPNQIHFFMRDLIQEEVDQINKIYSNGRYINKCIDRFDEYKLRRREEVYKQKIETDESVEAQAVISKSETQLAAERVTAAASVFITAAIEAAKNIKDAQGLTGYNKLRQIAKLK